MTKQSIPSARTNGLLIRKLDNEVLVYDYEIHQAHCLNAVAASVWEQCDGKRTVTDLSALLHQDEETIWLALAQLSEHNLLAQSLVQPHENLRLNRRQLLKASGAAALIALPIVSTIVAPTAAQASTCLASGDSCGVSAECCSGLCDTGICA